VASALQPFINTGSFNRDGLINTGSVSAVQSISGSLNISNSLNINPNAVLTLQTGSRMAVIGDNGGTPGAIGFFADGSTTRSFNIQAQPGGNGTIAMSDFPSNNHFMFYNMPLHWIQFEAPLTSTGSGNAIDVLYGMNIGMNQTSSAMGLKVTGSLNVTGSQHTIIGNTIITGSVILSGSAGPELDVKGDVLITGSVIMSGSAGIELDVKGDQTNTGSLTVRSGSLSTFSQGTTINTDLYLTNSLGGQSNIIKGWSDNPAGGGAAASQANYTGSLRITGSNNIVSMPQIRATGVGGGVDQQGYISGSDNTLTSNGGGIYLNTGSLLFPKTTNNYVGANSNILMNFTTSSLAGGHPTLINNTLYAGTITINSNSGSVLSLSANILNGAALTSTQNNIVTNTRPNIGSNALLGGAITLNHISSSINYNANINNAAVTINNHLSSSNITNNNVIASNNTFLGGQGGTGVNIWVSGSQSSNLSRNFNSNLIGGANAVISSSFVSSSNSNLLASIIYGNGLIVSASHNSGTLGGSAFFGRFNDTGSGLNLTQDIVFAVGTGTAAATRRTGLYVTSGSLVGVSGSMLVNGQTTMTASSGFPLYVSGTMQTQRIHFDGNPFNSEPASNLGALRYDGNNAAFSITNYNKAEITSGSFVELYLSTGSNYVHSKQFANYANTSAVTTLANSNGTRNFDVNVDTTTITGSVSISNLATSTGSFVVTTDNNGTLTKTTYSGLVSASFNVGTFYDTTTQSGSAAVSQSINFNTTDISQGVTVASNSR
jgi:hypothetical protein